MRSTAIGVAKPVGSRTGSARVSGRRLITAGVAIAGIAVAAIRLVGSGSMSPTVIAMVLTGAGVLCAVLWKRELRVLWKREVRRRASRRTSAPIGPREPTLAQRASEPTLAQRARARRVIFEQLAEQLKEQNADKQRRLAAGRVCALCKAVVWHDEPKHLMHGGEICPACLRHRGPYFPVDTPAGRRWV